MVDYNRIISDVQEENAFSLPDGTKLRSLAMLKDTLPRISDEFFKEHVNDSKNDFANWIRHCFEDELLADKISRLKTKEEIIGAIASRIEQAKVSIRLQEQNLLPQKQEATPENNLQTSQPSSPSQSPQSQSSPDMIDDALDANLDDSLDSALDNALDTGLDSGIEPVPPLMPVEKDLKAELNPETKQESTPAPISPVTTLPDIDDSLDTALDLSPDNLPEQKTEAASTAPTEQESVTPPETSPVPQSDTLPELPQSIQPTEQAQPVTPAEQDKKDILDNLKPVDEAPQISQLSKEPKLEKLELPKTIEQPKQEQQSIIPDRQTSTDSIKLSSEPSPEIRPSETKQQPESVQSASPAKEEPKKEEPPIEQSKPPTEEAQKTMPPLVPETIIATTQEPKIEQQKQIQEDIQLTDEEKLILHTDNKELNPKQLFKKIKLQRTIAARTAQTDKTKTETKEAAKHEEKAADESMTPVDLLALSEEEFHALIGVNLKEEFIAITSKEHIVKQKERKHLKTGVPGFDDLIEKGILEGSSILVSGGPGSGKTTFSIQQLGWAAEHGEKCLFISLEEKEERLIEHMKGYGLNPEKYLKDGNLKIKKLDSFKLARSVEALLAHARGELMIDIAPVLDIIPDGYNPDRVVLDSLSSIAAAFAGRPEEYRIYVEQLFNIFEQIGATSFIITEIQGSESMGHGGVEDFLADGVVNFYNMRKGTLRQPAIEVLKMRGVAHKKKVVPFSFISGKGLEVYPLEEVFHGE